MQHLVGILGFNNQARVDKCVASVLADLPPDSRVVLVDNGVNQLEAPPGCEYMPVNFQTHGGFTAALRLFLCDALAGDYTTATFLNDDLALEPGCLAAMIAKAQEQGVGLAFPMQVDMYNPQVIICGGTGAAYPAGIHKVGQRGVVPAPVEDTRWMPFAAVTFSMRAVEDVGLPDPNMTIWFSDSDYCLRARLQGWRIISLGETAVVRHEHSAAVKEMQEDDRRHAFEADQTAFARKWGGGLLAEYST